MYYIKMILSYVAISSCSLHASTAPINYTYTTWQNACKKLPSFTHGGNSVKHTALKWEEFEPVLNQFIQINHQWYVDRAQQWLDNKPCKNTFLKIFSVVPDFKPFVQKLVINPGVDVALRGDLHGDIHSLMAYLEFLKKEGHLDGFNIIDKNKFHMIFLGDYVDRGNYGLEVIYTLMRLKLANPDNVTMIRGNHEDRMICDRGGFLQEFETKFGIADHRYALTVKMYDCLPVALYLGSGSGQSKDFMQCCHGGMELGFNPVPLLNTSGPIAFSWIKKLNRMTEFNALDLKEHLPTPLAKFRYATQHGLDDFMVASCYAQIGFMWSDFAVDDDTKPLLTNSIRGSGIYEYGKVITHQMLKHASQSTHKVRGVLRAHQHTNHMDAMMKSILDPEDQTTHKGVSKLWKDKKGNNELEPELWDGIVCTFLVAPDSLYNSKDSNEYSVTQCNCENPDAYHGCKGKTPHAQKPCVGALYDFDAFAIMTTADTFDKWKMKVHRNMLEDIISTQTDAQHNESKALKDLQALTL